MDYSLGNEEWSLREATRDVESFPYYEDAIVAWKELWASGVVLAGCWAEMFLRRVIYVARCGFDPIFAAEENIAERHRVNKILNIKRGNDLGVMVRCAAISVAAHLTRHGSNNVRHD